MLHEHLWWYLAEFLKREMIKTKFVQKIKPHILFSVTFYRKLSVYNRKNTAEPDRAQMTMEQIKDAFCMPDKEGKSTDILINNANCFSTLSVVRRELLVFMLYVNCPSCYTERHWTDITQNFKIMADFKAGAKNAVSVIRFTFLKETW